MAARYAVYYAPDRDSQLAQVGNSWLGRDLESGDLLDQPEVVGVSATQIQSLTKAKRRYGFNCTLKPPFELNPTTTVNGLLETANVLAMGLSPIEMPKLELTPIGDFIALTLTSSSAVIDELASTCVRAFEGFRMPLSKERIARYRKDKLTVHQEQMLNHWGYPYVMEEFRFHMSLTDRISSVKKRENILHTLKELCDPVLAGTAPITNITVVGQKEPDQPMRVIEHFPFGQQPRYG